VKEDLQRLISLQQVDLRLEELADRKRRIPELVAVAQRPLQAAQAQYEAAKKEFDTTTKDRKAREDELAVQEQAISKLQDRAVKGEIKTNKEFQAHKFEIDLAKKKKGELEEQLLILMDQVDAKKKELAKGEAAMKEAERTFAAEKASLESSVGDVDQELTQNTERRKEMAAAVEKSLLRSYERLRGSRKGQALAGVTKEGSCMACRLQIQPQVVSDVKRGMSVLTCTYCQRILYWVGEPYQGTAELEEETAEKTE
jgi:predicted  nucleic acid-binding Zn-ribbon protein